MATGRIGASKAAALHLICALGLAVGHWLAGKAYSWTLITYPDETLRILLLVQCPAVIGVYTFLRRDPDRCPSWVAAGRGLLGLPVGALLNAFGAIVLGAPVGMKYMTKTLNWSLLMSLFNFVPAACVFGLSRMDWQRMLAHSKPVEDADYMISLPAHGAVIGAWFGAWPMPLDWERPWQEWPICVTWGSLAGYLVGMLASLLFILAQRRQLHTKGD